MPRTRRIDGLAICYAESEDHDQFVCTAEGWKLVSRRWGELFTRGDVLNLP
jgi:hypothetical protein